MSELVDAFNALAQRKERAGLGMAVDGHGAPAREFPSITGAYGLDVSELGMLGRAVASQSAILLAQTELDPVAVFAGVWADGVMVGLELARLREEAGS